MTLMGYTIFYVVYNALTTYMYCLKRECMLNIDEREETDMLLVYIYCLFSIGPIIV